MSFIPRLGPYIIVGEGGICCLSIFSTTKNGDLIIQKEELQLQATFPKWQQPLKFESISGNDDMKRLSTKNGERFYSFYAYDPELNKLFILIWDSTDKSLYRYDTSANNLLRFGEFGKVEDVSPDNYALISGQISDLGLSRFVVREKVAAATRQKNFYRQHYWKIIGNLRYISSKAIKKFFDAAKKRFGFQLSKKASGDEDAQINALIFFFWNKLLYIKQSTYSRREYFNALRYLQTSDIKYLENLSLNTLEAITNLYASYNKELKDFCHRRNIPDGIFRANPLHEILMDAISAEKEKYSSRDSIKQESHARISPEETATDRRTRMRERQKRDKTPLQALLNIVEYRLSEFTEVSNRYTSNLESKETVIAQLNNLHALLENDYVWEQLPSPMKAQLYFSLRLVFYELDMEIPLNSRLDILKRQFPMINNYIWPRKIERALEILKTLAISDVKPSYDDISEVNKLDGEEYEIIWNVVFNNAKLRRIFLGTPELVKERARKSPSVASDIAKHKSFRDYYYPRAELSALVDIATQKTHLRAATALYHEEHDFLSFQVDNKHPLAGFTRGELLACNHLELFIEMINDKSDLLTDRNLGRVFDIIWAEHNKVQSSELKLINLVEILKDSKYYTIKNSRKFNAAKRRFFPSRLMFDFFGKGGGDSSGSVHVNPETQQYRI